MSIWMFSRDIGFLEQGEVCSVENTIDRHIGYFSKINLIDKDSELHVFVLTPSSNNFSEIEVIKGFLIKRINPSVLGVISFLFYCLTNKNKLPKLLTTQTPFLDGLLGILVGRLFGISTMVQLHFDVTSENWRIERSRNFVLYLIAKYVLKTSTSIRTVSNKLRIKLIEELGIDHKKIYVVPVSINKKYIQNYSLDRSKQETYKIYGVGRLVKQKDFMLFLQIAEQFKLDNKYKFIIVGDGPEKDHLDFELIRLDLRNVEFLGHKKPNMMNECYSKADIVLVTSKYEGYCRVVEEALMFGAPVISSACTGPEDMIIDGVNGYVINSRTASEYVEKLKDITKSRIVYGQFSKAAFASRPRSQYKFSDFGELLLKNL